MNDLSYQEVTTKTTASNPLFFSNPQNVNDIGDPYALKASDGLYYMFATSAPDNGYYGWSSSDLINWDNKRMAFIKSEDSWCKRSFWAPEVIEYKNKYYMFYTAQNENGSLRIGLATSDSPAGMYTDPVNKPLFDLGYAAIDAHVFIDDDDRKYLYYAKDCSENFVDGMKKSEIYGVELAPDMMSTVGEHVLLATPTALWEANSTDTIWNEGPEVVKENGIYYLTYSGNFFANRSYSLGYATSNSPLGKFTKPDNNHILEAGNYKDISGPGHHSFTRSPDGSELWMAYHTHTFPSIGGGNRQVNLDRVVFNDKGELYVNGPTIHPLPRPSDGSFKNTALTSTFKSGDETINLLNDDMFSVHKKHITLDWSPTCIDGKVTVTADLGGNKKVIGISIYKGIELGFKSVDITLDDSHSAVGINAPEDYQDRALVLDIEETSASTVTFTFHPNDNNDSVGLSEIIILTSNK